MNSHQFSFMSGMGLMVCGLAVDGRNWVMLFGAVIYTASAAAGFVHARAQEREP